MTFIMLPKTLSSFIWYFVKRYKIGLLGLCFVAFLWAVERSLSPYLLKILLNKVASAPSTLKEWLEIILFPAIAYYLSSNSSLVFFRFYDYTFLKTIPALQKEIWAEMFAYLSRHSHSYFHNNYAGALANKISDMIRSVEVIVTMITDVLLSHFLALFVASVTLAFIHPSLGLILIVWAVLFILMSVHFSKGTKKHTKFLAEARSALSGKAVDSLTNISNVRLFAAYEYESGYLAVTLDDILVRDQRLQRYLLKVKTVQGIAHGFLMAVMLGALIYGRFKGFITIGDFALVLVLSQNIADIVFRFSEKLLKFAEAIGVGKQALSIIAQPHEIIDQPNAKALCVDKGKIQFENVKFGYIADGGLFKDLNVNIPGHQKVGLVGFSGSGKTTFVNLILRNYELQAGRILIDNQNIRSVTQESLHKSISTIPQEPILFHRSLIDNIRYGNLMASEREVIEASKKAHCHDFIMKIPGTYNALVGERGVKLSGGQRQRIAIARAILKDAPILLLDEATSALDSETEKKIQESLVYLFEHRTVIIIAHRLSTLLGVDRLLVFKEGQIIEDGIHKELLNKGGHYAALWNMQAGGFLPKERLK
jgi:ATP-binding cassette subfamily B protein